MSETISLTVNGVKQTVSCSGKESLLEILRDYLDLTGTKEGCGYGSCGSCTVVVNGEAVNACVFRGKDRIDGAEVITIEGLARGNGELHPIQESFLETGAVQCGFCTPGFILRLFALYRKNPKASQGEIRDALSKHLCRCTGYEAIWEAALLAHKKMNEEVE